jgi:hypothetical protein
VAWESSGKFEELDAEKTALSFACSHGLLTCSLDDGVRVFTESKLGSQEKKIGAKMNSSPAADVNAIEV